MTRCIPWGDRPLWCRRTLRRFGDTPLAPPWAKVGPCAIRPALGIPVKGGDPAMARRMVLMPFEQKFEGSAKDHKLPEKLKAEAPGILAWAVRGAVKWYADGLAIPSRVEAVSKDYMSEHDDISMWIEECCETMSHLKARSSDLYASFRRWKQSRGEHEPSQTVWGEKMTLVPGLTKVAMKGIRTLKGIDLNASEKAKMQGLP